MTWVIVAYLVVNTALVLSLGRKLLACRHVRKEAIHNVRFVAFTIGSVLCGFAPSGLALAVFGVVQGAALLTSNSFAILSEAFHP